MPKEYISSRSAYSTYLISQRQFYVQYCAFKYGLVEKELNIHLMIGTYCHEVIGKVMGGMSEQEAQAQQTAIWLEAVNERGMSSSWNPEHLLSLSQGLSSSWLRSRLPVIKEDFTIEAVEQERKLVFEDKEDNFTLIIPTRIDAEIRNRCTQNYFALELKTIKWKRNVLDKYTYDIQPLMHYLAMLKEYNDCAGIMMEFLYKGTVTTKDKKQRWNSVFMKAWMKSGVPPYDKTEYEIEYTKARGKDWIEFCVPEAGISQEEWYKIIGKRLDKDLTFGTVVRLESELFDFSRQLLEGHKRIVEGLERIDGASSIEEKKYLLNIYFPLAYHPFDKHLIGFDPFDESLLEPGSEWMLRESHHPLETEFLNSQ